jgi:hypothetical protein
MTVPTEKMDRKAPKVIQELQVLREQTEEQFCKGIKEKQDRKDQQELTDQIQQLQVPEARKEEQERRDHKDQQELTDQTQQLLVPKAPKVKQGRQEPKDQQELTDQTQQLRVPKDQQGMRDPKEIRERLDLEGTQGPQVLRVQMEQQF